MAILTDEESNGAGETELLIPEVEEETRRRRRSRAVQASGMVVILAAFVAIAVLVTLALGGGPTSTTRRSNFNAAPTAAPGIPVKDGLIAFQPLGANHGLEFVNPVGSGLRYATGYSCGRSATSCEVPGGKSSFAWSPDGMQLAYLAGSDFSSTRENTLYLVGTDGQLRRLTVCGHCQGVSWSPDGSQIAVGRYVPGVEGGLNVWVVNAKTGAMRQITDCKSDPACRTADYLAYFDTQWSATANGQEILFTRINSNGEGSSTYTVRPNGSDLTELKSLRTWSSNGQEFAADTRTGFEIADADGKDLTNVAGGAVVAWSPDGTKLMYTATVRQGRLDGVLFPEEGYWTINADGSDRRLVYTNRPVVGTGWGYVPFWSPDGRQIMFSTGQGTYVINADGSDLHRIGAGNALLAWQP